MPFIKKEHLKDIIVAAFNEGLIVGVGIDHDEGSVEQFFGSIDVDEFYNNNCIIQAAIKNHN